MNPVRTGVTLAAIAVLAIAAAAQAHVTLQPTTVPAGAFTRLDAPATLPQALADAPAPRIALRDGAGEFRVLLGRA